MKYGTYGKIFRDLKQSIENFEYKSGENLPGEIALSKHYECSRNTIRRALKELEKIGYITMIKGVGSLVLYDTNLLNKFGTIGEEFYHNYSENKREEFVKNVVYFNKESVDEKLHNNSTFDLDILVYHIIRTRSLNGKCMLYEHNYLSCEYFEDLTEKEASDSIYKFIKDKYNRSISAHKRYLTIEKVNESDRKYLELEDYNAVPVVSTYSYNKHGDIVEYTISRHVPNKFVLFNQSEENPVTFY